MVTEIHEDIENEYMNIDEWIEYGIIDDAIYVVATRWYKQNPIRDFFLSEIRNDVTHHYFGSNEFIQPLNKW